VQHHHHRNELGTHLSRWAVEWWMWQAAADGAMSIWL